MAVMTATRQTGRVSTITRQIKNFVLTQAGMDKVGIAGVERFHGSPEGFHPTDFLPGCKSVIVFCIRLPDGAVQSTYRVFEDRLMHVHGVYGAFAYFGAPNFKLLMGNHKIAQFVERVTGETAMPNTAGPLHGRKMMSMRHCAVAAGLGEFGWSSIVLTPEFGPRNRFGAVLTTAELEPDPMYEGPRLCDPQKCHVCEKMCPTGAIPPYKRGQEREITVGEREFSYSGINWNKCRIACHGLYAEYNATGTDLIDRELTNPRDCELMPRVGHFGKPKNMMTESFQHNPTWKCGNCLTYCPVGNWKERFYDRGLSKVDIPQYIDD